MSTILIIFCNFNKIATCKTKKFANTSNKKNKIFVILADALCPLSNAVISIIRNHPNTKSSQQMFHHKRNLI